MFSKAAKKSKIGWDEDFQWRGTEVMRIEGLADAVFGLAVTMLIISTEVPRTYGELMRVVRGFFPFAACFAQLMLVWYQHYKFYRRYALQDPITTVYSLVLLFLVLFYVYPLKFVFSAWLTPNEFQVHRLVEVSRIFTLYGAGYISVFVIFALMHLRALKKKEELHLTPLEIWDTKHSVRETTIYCSVGLLSIALANSGDATLIQSAGPVYGLVGLGAWWHGAWSGKKRSKLYKKTMAVLVD
jgi:uncharacterized membrane protein